MSFEALSPVLPNNVVNSLAGRYLTSDKTAHDCLVENLSLDGATLVNCDCAPQGARIVLYMEGMGRLVADVVTSGDNIMDVTFDQACSNLDPLKAGLAGTSRTIIADERRLQQRFNPDNPLKPVRLPHGETRQCEVSDISLSGALIQLDVLVPIGAQVWLGNSPAYVAERREEGTVIRFKEPLDGEALAELTR